ncbi:MAG: UDP-N-acetylmuramoyl-L-alanine--D-glutamate ligase [Parvibaculales bacterium]
MIAVSTFRGSVGVYGLGLSGMSCVHSLLAGGCHVLAWDEDPDRRAAAGDLGAEIDPLENLPVALEALVLSPGIALTHPEPHPVVLRARAAGVAVLGDMALFRMALQDAPETRAPIIAITGTNGKSTTTALTAHLLKAQGMDVRMGGNIGKPVLELGLPHDNTVYVLELSSYQIDLSPDFRADVAVLLNLSPDHIDRHGTFDNYRNAKWRLFEALPSDGLALVSVDDESCAALARACGPDLAAAVKTFSCDLDSADYFATSRQLHDQLGQFADISDVPSLQGRHNVQNALAAFAAASQLCDDRNALARAYKSFPGLAHRLQQVRQFGSTSFVNDSKATNAAATRHALGAFDNIFWIAGGRAKDEGVAPLIDDLQSVRKAYLIGEAAEAYADTLSGHVPCVVSGTLEKAVPNATEDAVSSGGGVVLFSPSSASFDQFDNFERRGEAFVQIVDRCLDGRLREERA